MSESIDLLISKYVQGNLSVEEQVLFDRKFEADPGFSEKVLEAMGRRLGPGPEAFLDRMGRTARPAVEEAWRRKVKTMARVTSGSGFSQAWSVVLPVVVLLAALLGLVGVGKFMISREQDRQASLWKAEAETPSTQAAEEAPIIPEIKKPVRHLPTVSKNENRVEDDQAFVSNAREGHSVRFQNLPVSAKTTIVILDAKGVVVKRLYEGPWKNGQKLDWDGLDHAGKPVKPGVYRAGVMSSKGTFVSRFTVK
jgi:hypothetical protein